MINSNNKAMIKSINCKEHIISMNKTDHLLLVCFQRLFIVLTSVFNFLYHWDSYFVKVFIFHLRLTRIRWSISAKQLLDSFVFTCLFLKENLMSDLLKIMWKSSLEENTTLFDGHIVPTFNYYVPTLFSQSPGTFKSVYIKLLIKCYDW